MGNHSSKSNEMEDIIKQNTNILLDPRSPDINRTPLTGIHNRVRKNASIPSTPSTPKNSSYQIKSIKSNFDPRSPSQFIPRTPLNISLDDDKIESSSTQYSLEYSGLVEEASCRHFNERLANITFDSSFTEPQNDKHAEEEELKPLAENIAVDMEKNSSPYIRSAFTSTPNVEFYAKQNKKSKVMDYVTPLKKMENIKEVRSPFGCLLNKSFDNLSQQQKFRTNNTNDENYTPKMKKTTKNGGIRKHKQIFCD